MVIRHLELFHTTPYNNHSEGDVMRNIFTAAAGFAGRIRSSTFYADQPDYCSAHKLKLLLLIASLLLIGCQSTHNKLAPVSQIPAGVAREGSLANEALIRDTSAAIYKQLNLSESDIAKGVKIIKFVIQQPVGDVGRKAWRELWVYNPGSPDSASYIITFQEDGTGSADFIIQKG